jgi:cytochrome c5
MQPSVAGSPISGHPARDGQAAAFLPGGAADIIAAFPGHGPPVGLPVRHHDLVFLKHFSQVIGFLVVVTISLIGLGYYLNTRMPEHVNPVAQAKVTARIQPAGAVYAGATGAAAQAQAAQAALEAAKGQVAYDGTLDGSVIFGNLCTGCHTAGVGGAPKLVKGDWTARLAQGKDVLHKHAIEGYKNVGVMPAKGGNPALTDAQVIATVDWMLTQLK